MDKGFYVAFENKFRGSEELIKDRQRKYLKFINPLKKIKDEVKALDIGCGRGEWLSLLSENGFKARGIDIDEDMVELAVQKGFNVVKNDALSELRSLEDNSLDIISAFQVVEHIDFNDVLEICKEAMRVLAPCGILILETPNPENIMVSTQWFYLDATHKKPIPCELLAFAAEYFGFKRNIVMRLNEEDIRGQEHNIELFDVFEKVSPDYSIVSQKDGDSISIFDSAFSEVSGVNLNQISAIYSNALKFNINKAYDEFDIGIKNEILSSKEEINRIKSEILHFKEEINGIKNSRSWRITKPLREIAGLARVIRAKFRICLSKSAFIIKKMDSLYHFSQAKILTKKELEIYKRLKKD